jgi:hypothetical protein
MKTSNLRLFRVVNKYTEMHKIPEGASFLDLGQIDGASTWHLTTHYLNFKVSQVHATLTVYCYLGSNT